MIGTRCSTASQPRPGSQGVKVATEQSADTLADPDLLRRVVALQDASAMRDTRVSGRLTGVLPERLRSAACICTVTRDGDFLIGRAPENERLLVVSACSGHGFMHSAGLGEAVAASLWAG